MVYEASGAAAYADGARGFVELPEGEDATDDDTDPDHDDDGHCVFCGEAVPDANNVPAVVDAKPRRDDVAQGSTGGEGDHKFFPRHLECARCEDEGAERHGRRKDRGDCNGEDGVAFHPVADSFEDARVDAFFEEGHAAALADEMAEVSADRRPNAGEQNEEDEVLMLRGHDDDHDVGDAGHGQWNEGAVDNRNQKDAAESEAEEEVKEGVSGSAMRCGGLKGSICEVLRRGEGRCEELHT